jgi:hypothetical protein
MNDEDQKNNVCTPSICAEPPQPEAPLPDPVSETILPLAIIFAMFIFLFKLGSFRDMLCRLLKRL